MKNIVAYSLLSVALLMSACSEEDYQSAQSLYNDGEVHEITAISGKFDLDSIASRTIIAMSDSSIASPVWAANDTIGIYPDAGDQLSFPIVDGVGTNTCVFNGGGWALKSSSTYTAYSPFNRMYYFAESNALPVSMLGQKQKGNDNSEHLGAYDLQIAKGTAPASGKISFSFKHQVAIVRLDLTAPVTASWASVSLESDADFTLKATMDLTLDTPALSVDSTANCFTLELEDVKTTADSTLITAYMMLLPVDFTDKSLSVRLTDVDGNSYTTDATIVRDKTNFVASAARWITANFLEDDIPYVTFTADAEQTLTMSQAVETLEYSVGNGEWTTLGTTTVTFGGDNGTLRLRGKSAIGTATSSSDYSQISFGNETSVACSGDICTLVDYENYATANTENARFCLLFKDCVALTSTPKLPATTLANQCYYDMFNNCIGLVISPELPATELASECYFGMFRYCSGLTTPPVLPATTLSECCYGAMFSNCIKLETAPVLCATTLTNSCYNGMFSGCTSLTSAPELPAKTLTEWCYFDMFSGCTALTSTPELPATVLAEYCYSQMFKGCTNLSTTPELPVTTLANYCYNHMFSDCTGLTSTPVLPATVLVEGCYDSMFRRCSNLNEVTMLATDISATSCLGAWLSGVASTGTFTKAATMTSLPEGASGIPTGWTVKNYGETEEVDNTPYVTFTADAAQTLTMTKAVETLEYSVGNGDWATLGTTTVTFGGDNGTLRLRGKSSIGTAASSSDYSQISFGNSTSVTCSGDIRTLVDYENYASASTENARFFQLFYNCTSLTEAPSLPATTLASECYSSMFYGCTGLTTAPELPAVNLSSQCYRAMFMGCTSLISAPELPATTLVSTCYQAMFSGCTSLTSAPELPAMTLADWCYAYMFYGCTGLTTAPTLPAENLIEYCYSQMFYNCTNLNNITMLATSLASYSLFDWLNGVSSTGTFTKASTMTSLPEGESGIPSGWTVVDYKE